MEEADEESYGEEHYDKFEQEDQADGNISTRTQPKEEFDQHLLLNVKGALDDHLSNSRRSSRLSSKRLVSEQEDKQLEEKNQQEEEDLKKFILLAKLKYENSIKGYDRIAGLKQTLDEFSDALMEKLF